MVDISTVGITLVPGAKKRSGMETSRRELSEDVPFGIWHPLGCGAIELGKTAPGRCDIHRRCVRGYIRSATWGLCTTCSQHTVHTGQLFVGRKWEKVAQAGFLFLFRMGGGFYT